MSRRIVLAWTCLLIAATSALGQLQVSSNLIPTPTSLARLGLKRHWFAVVPLSGTERIAELSVDGQLVYAQTNEGNFHVLTSETGQWLWAAHLGSVTPKGLGASSNSTAVFVTNANELFAFARSNGQLLWKKHLDNAASSPTAADEKRVYVGLVSGRLSVHDAINGKQLWVADSKGPLVSRPIPADKVVVFASSNGKVNVMRAERLETLLRWSAVGPIVAPLGTSGPRTLLVASEDKSLYSLDLFKGETNWNFPTGAPIDIEPLVGGQDVYVVNKEGLFSRVDLKTGTPFWTISTLGGPLLAVTEKRVYLESRDGDLFIVDRATGQMLFDPRATHYTARVDIRGFEFGPTNRLNDRLYMGSKSGLIVCLRELDQVQPRPLRDPKEKPIGYIPPEGYVEKVIPPVDPTLEAAPGGDTPAPAPAEKPEAEKPEGEPK